MASSVQINERRYHERRERRGPPLGGDSAEVPQPLPQWGGKPPRVVDAGVFACSVRSTTFACHQEESDMTKLNPASSLDAEPFKVDIPQAALDDVTARLKSFRWVDEPE